MYRESSGEHDGVLGVDGPMGEAGNEQLIPTSPQEQNLVLERQGGEVRNILGPLDQLEQLFVSRLAEICYSILEKHSIVNKSSTKW